MSDRNIMWGAFILLMGVMVLLDLGLNRSSRQVTIREALYWSLLWVGLALAFNTGIYFTMGKQPALEFFAGYLIEKSLSVDNLFVFIMIFSTFGVKGELQTRVLKWGILGALVMRVAFIYLGTEMLERFQGAFYFFGALLLYTAWKMAFSDEEALQPEDNPLVKLSRRFLTMTKRIRGDWFFTKKRGLLIASPLFMVLLVVESSDLMFAMDSIPAVFAITLDPFIVLTSNIFAIMGLRALYFLLAGVMGMFVYLKFGISFILAFVGIKMVLVMQGVHIPIGWSLSVIVTTLLVAIVCSVRACEADETE